MVLDIFSAIILAYFVINMGPAIGNSIFNGIPKVVSLLYEMVLFAIPWLIKGFVFIFLPLMVVALILVGIAESSAIGYMVVTWFLGGVLLYCLVEWIVLAFTFRLR